jgi:hypothetical protein
VLRAAGEAETMQENIQDWLKLDEEPEFQFLTEEEIVAVIFFYLFSSALLTVIYFPFICFLSLFFSFRASFCFINTDYRLIWMTSPTVNPD